ncbi:hypothetical protein ACHQM5_002868 [Ranunculus cassubicifolius]
MKKSLGEEDKNDARQLQCVRKYDLILKQFNELMEMVDAQTRPSKRRKISSRKKGEGSSTNVDQELMQTITNYLNELND